MAHGAAKGDGFWPEEYAQEEGRAEVAADLAKGLRVPLCPPEQHECPHEHEHPRDVPQRGLAHEGLDSEAHIQIGGFRETQGQKVHRALLAAVARGRLGAIRHHGRALRRGPQSGTRGTVLHRGILGEQRIQGGLEMALEHLFLGDHLAQVAL